MPFNPNDMYATSAGTEIFNYFNPFVTKFDSESFYNFEQDNQPLFDLEERTFGLWEKSTGYYTSSLNGMPLVVSSTTSSESRGVFTNLQEAIDALPNVIRTPTLVEVAVSGYLGGLKLKNIKIVENGVLEIINRGFAKIYSGKGGMVSTSSVGKGQPTGIASEGYLTVVSSHDLSATITDTSAMGSMNYKEAGGFISTSSLFESSFNRTFVQVINHASNMQRTGRLSLGFMDPTNTATPFVSATGYMAFNIANYELNAFGITGNVTDKTPGSLDVSSVRGDTQARLSRGTGTAAATNNFNLREVGGLTYVNALSSIEVENCNGPLYIRGFCVDGVSGAAGLYLNSTYKSDVGISVINSNPVIENCSVMRCTQTGAKFINSDVTLARGFFADRNYLVNESGAGRSSQDTIGLHAINSNVSLEINALYASGSDFLFNTQNHTYGAVFENSVIKGGQSRYAAIENDTSLGFAYNKVGIKAINSTFDLSGNLDVYNNNKGIQLIDSTLSTDRLTIENHTFDGLMAQNSVIKYNNSLVRRDYLSDIDSKRITQTLFLENATHLNLNEGSRFTYYQDPAASAFNLPTKFGALRFVENHGVSSAPAIRINQSQAELFHPRISASSMQIQTVRTDVKGAAVRAEDSSLVTFLGTLNGATIIEGNPSVATGGRRVIGVYAGDNSKVSFRGPTAIVQFGTGVLAENNSIMEFIPHTTPYGKVDIDGYNLTNTGNHTSVELHATNKTCLAANNNSQIIMRDLGSANALYSNQSSDYNDAVIANCVSGGSMQFYPNAALASLATSRDDVYFADGDVDDDKFTASSFDLRIGHGAAAGSVAYAPIVKYNYKITDFYDNASSAIINNTISAGGMCVQAFGNSIVNVNNVNFPTGYINAEGTYFDPSAAAAGCNTIRIWNIADTSKLYASHLAVSGLAPSGVNLAVGFPAYHGPRAVYLSGLEGGDEYGAGTVVAVAGDSKDVAYGALSSTTDTSTLSVCDTFGLGVQISSTYTGQSDLISLHASAINLATANRADVFGWLTPQNKGPFRIYFSPNPAMNYLGYASGINVHGSYSLAEDKQDWTSQDSRPTQQIAQGYSLSGMVGVPSGILVQSEGIDASAMHNILLNVVHAEDHGGSMAGPFMAASGYYYPSAMLPSDGPHVFLDDSAADVFANAKHCASSPFSGRGNPLVAIYRSRTDDGGVAAKSDTPFGAGIRSTSIFDSRRDL